MKALLQPATAFFFFFPLNNHNKSPKWRMQTHHLVAGHDHEVDPRLDDQKPAAGSNGKRNVLLLAKTVAAVVETAATRTSSAATATARPGVIAIGMIDGIETATATTIAQGKIAPRPDETTTLLLPPGNGMPLVTGAAPQDESARHDGTDQGISQEKKRRRSPGNPSRHKKK